MAGYILKRFLYSVLTLYIIATVTFFLMHAIPGSIYTGEKNLPPTVVKNMKAKYSLDRPLHEQYFTVLGNLARLDFGMSMKREGRSVNGIIAQAFPVSAGLGLLAIFLCLAAGIPLGVVSALKAGKWQDHAAMIAATLGVTVPSFVAAVLAQYFLAVRLDWFPATGLSTPWHAVLPALMLSLYPLSFIARLVRSGMLEALGQDYIRAARARGLSEGAVIYKHALKNSMLPVITYLGPLMAGVLTGSFVIEKVFNIAGLGRYFVDSISGRDYTTVMGVTVFFAALLIFMNFIVDIVYVMIDPRIKLTAK